MKDIIDYLEVNIDGIKRKGRNAGRATTQTGFHACLPPVKTNSIGSRSMNTSPKKDVKVSKNFNQKEYEDRMNSV